MKRFSLFIAFGAALVLFFGWGWSASHQNQPRSNAQPILAPSLPNVASGKEVTTSSQSDPAAVADLLSFLRTKGRFTDVPQLANVLRRAEAAGDRAEISRVFSDAVYSRLWKTSDAISDLKGFLNSKDPFVRYKAAEALFVLGSTAGYDALLDLVKLNRPIEVLGQDIRVGAAALLGRYKQRDAIYEITSLYSRTHDPEIGAVLADLSVPLPNIDTLAFVPSPLAIIQYGKMNTETFLPQIESVFKSTKNTELKVAAAWTLVTLNGDEPAMNFLTETVKTIIGTNARSHEALTAFKLFASLRNPAVTPILEDALSSRNRDLVQIAVANLVFVQGESEKATEVIVGQLSDPSHAQLLWEFTLSMASKLVENPKIVAAGKRFASHDSNGDWQLYTEDRKDWPVESWLGDYVYTLHR